MAETPLWRKGDSNACPTGRTRQDHSGMAGRVVLRNVRVKRAGECGEPGRNGHLIARPLAFRACSPALSRLSGESSRASGNGRKRRDAAAEAQPANRVLMPLCGSWSQMRCSGMTDALEAFGIRRLWRAMAQAPLY